MWSTDGWSLPGFSVLTCTGLYYPRYKGDFFFFYSSLSTCTALLTGQTVWPSTPCCNCQFLLWLKNTDMMDSSTHKSLSDSKPLVTRIRCLLNQFDHFQGQLSNNTPLMASVKKRLRAADSRPTLKTNSLYNCCLSL